MLITVWNVDRNKHDVKTLADKCYRHHRILILFTLILLTSQIILATAPAQAQAPIILPVPYYSQGNKPYCLPAVTRMALAYMMYPNSPPTLEQLVEEMGSNVDGTSFYMIMTPFAKRGLSQFLRSADFNDIDSAIRAGYVVYVGLDQAGLVHAVLVVGIKDYNYFIVHDPAIGPACALARSEVQMRWIRGMIFGFCPASKPSYTVRISMQPRISETYADGRLATNPLSFPVGTTHTISVDSTVPFSNETTRFVWNCFHPSHQVFTWNLQMLEVTFTYDQTEAQYRITHLGTQMWIKAGNTYTATAQPGLLMKFQGWYSNGELVSKDRNLELQVTKPLTLEEKWELDYLQVLIVVAALGILLLLLAKRRAKNH